MKREMIDCIVKELQNSRRPFRQVRLPRKPGLYGFFLTIGASLPPFGGPGDLVYVGKSESSLEDRDLGQHFQTGASGHSTVRRSLGAILRKQRGFTAIPRSPCLTRRDFRSYRFRQQDEETLSAWMADNLEIGYALVPDPGHSLGDVEDAVLEVLVPPLNIDGKSAKRNPFAPLLRALRGRV